MSLRTRLILAFFLLSVVPMAAVTTYTYTTNVEALRVAAEHEADLLAGELGQRMTLVAAQLSERVEHLMDIAELEASADTAAPQSGASPAGAPAATMQIAVATKPVLPATTVVSTMSPQLLTDSIAKSLGETALLFNNVRFNNQRGGGGPGGRGGNVGSTGRGGPPQPMPATTPVASGAGTAAGSRTRPSSTPTATPTATPAASATPVTQVAGASPVPTPQQGRGDRNFGGDPRRGGRPGGGGAGARGDAVPAGSPKPGQSPPPLPIPPNAPGPPGQPPVQTVTITPVHDANGNLTIDIGPLRRDLFRQVLPPGKTFEDLSQEERSRLAAEVNQRLIGIQQGLQQGLQIGAAELQKRALEAEKQAVVQEAAAKKAAADTTKKTTKAAAAPDGVTDLRRKSSLSGNSIAVNVESNGTVVRSLNAELNLPNVLATVFSTTKRDRGEVPFAVEKDGTLHARSAADKVLVSALGPVTKPGGPAVVRLADYVVVTTEDTSGSGLRFGIARPVGDSLADLRKTTARNAGLGLLFVTVALVGMVPLSTRLTRNFSTLSEAVGRIAHGDYAARVPVNSNDEAGQLATAFNQMAADVERHQKTAVEQERIRRELELGRRIQHDMLPRTALTFGLTQVEGISVPAREVGGDYFNYFALDNGHIALLMGDVSGKGVGAALLMANLQASLRIRLGLGQTLCDVAEALDQDIEKNTPGPVYSTLFMALLDPATRLLRYVNAGHNPQYVLRKDGGLDRMTATGMPVGLFAGRGYTERTVQLQAGDLLFLFTDGCVEEENEKGDMFGVERLEALLHDARNVSDPLRHVEAALNSFRGPTEPLDDATLMTVRVG